MQAQPLSAARMQEHALSAARMQEHALSAARMQEHPLSSARMQEQSMSATSMLEYSLSAPRMQEHTLSAARMQEHTLSAAIMQEHSLSATRMQEHSLSATRMREQGLSAKLMTNFMELGKGEMSSFPFRRSPPSCGMPPAWFVHEMQPYNFLGPALPAQGCCCRRMAASDPVKDRPGSTRMEVEETASPWTAPLSPPSPPLPPSPEEAEPERWKRHVRKMEAIEEHNDYENIVRMWDFYSHKKFRNFQASGRSVSAAAGSSSAHQTMAAEMADLRKEAAACPAETHQLLQMPGATFRQSVIMISKRAADGAASSSQLDPLGELPLDKTAEEQADCDSDSLMDVKEEVVEELGNLVDTEGETLETLEQILEVGVPQRETLYTLEQILR